jgi:hypothetical protein
VDEDVVDTISVAVRLSGDIRHVTWFCQRLQMRAPRYRSWCVDDA